VHSELAENCPMRLIRSLSALGIEAGGNRRVVAIGAFDGLHLGHEVILQRARELAREREEPATVFTFEPTPAEYFALENPPARLTCFRERMDLLTDFGIDEVYCPHFRTVRRYTHQRFVDELLVEKLRVGHVVVGHDFRFGANRGGTLEDLHAAGQRHGFGLTAIDPVFLDGRRISSTQIRKALVSGDLAAARHMLGRDYSMSGRVVHGLGLGKKLGFPTANVNLKRRLAPVDGIFAVQVAGLGARLLDGVASVGTRPTVGGGKALLEVFLFDFDREIYGSYITVRFIARLRAEEKFDDIETMQRQMHIDVSDAQAALKQRIA
jgi:riboflavin kinase/FMN adenylyltransferase